MAPNVEIIRNYPRTELLRDGWSKSILATNMIPAQYNAQKDAYEEGSLPEDLWREPNTGVIMLRPSALRQDFWEDTTWQPFRMPLAHWTYNTSGGATNSLLSVVHNDSIHTVRPDTVTALPTLTLTGFLNKLIDCLDMRPVMSSNDPLVPNEGWTVSVHPPGIYTERAVDYMGVSFGDKYHLTLNMNGTADLWVYIGDGTTHEWIKKVSFSYAGGGVEHGKSFQVTVIPWGFGYITFLFSQDRIRRIGLTGAIRTTEYTSFLYDIGRQEGKAALHYDSSIKQWIKTKQSNLHVWVRPIFHHYGFAWSRVRYSASTAILQVYPQRLPEPKPQDNPTIQFRGFEGQLPPTGTGTKLRTFFYNEHDTSWDKDVDTGLVTQYEFTSDSQHLYTPELWSVDMTIPVATFTPNWTPQYPTNWSYVRFQRTADSDVSSATVKFVDDSYTNLLKGWGPMRINVEGTVCFDGYATTKMPTLEPWRDTPNSKMKTSVSAQIDCRDMWTRFNEKIISDYKFLDGLNLLDTIKELVKHCGFLEADILVDDTSGYLAAITIEGFSDPNDQKGITPESKVGDVLRQFLKNFSLLPIRIRPVAGKIKIYLAPQYSSSSPPTKKFYMFSDPAQSDATRIAAHKYYILSNPELTLEEPEFNGLIGRAIEGTAGGGSEGLQSVIPATSPDGNTVQDDTQFWFIGRAKVKIVGPPEITMASSQDELDKLTRVYWDRFSKHRAVLEFTAEWRPEMDVDDFIWVIGKNDQSGGSNATVSYGAYRIDSIDVEGQYDNAGHDGRVTDVRWTWQANYTCVYVGEATDGSTPMFTTVLPT